MRIWVDLDNTPHVPFFAPVITELEGRGHEVVITARDAFQVCDLADEMGIPYTRMGHHWGKNAVRKVIGLLWRATQLLRFFLKTRPKLALSHGSRAQTLLCNVLGVPTVVGDDYECSRTIRAARPRWLLIPDALAYEDLRPGLARDRVLRYRGLKEDVYVPEFRPDPSILQELGLTPNEIIVTVRPPADEAHYRDAESDILLERLMARIHGSVGVRAVLVPRNKRQEQRLRLEHPEWFADAKTIVPPRAVDGLNLLWHSDLAVSGGGTMNREAAALGVPAFSIFRGAMGKVDKRLEREGRLSIVRSVEEVESKISLVARDKPAQPDPSPRPALTDIVDHVEHIIEVEYGPGR